MNNSQIAHDLAVAYAGSKMAEYNVGKREALLLGNNSMSAEEIQYLKSAYDFAIKHLTERS